MADTTERLLLQVDAATELLRRHMAEGEQPLARFEQRAGKMAENVDRSIGSMGSKLGAFASLAEDAATRAQRAFDASFSDIQKLAAKAIEAPTVRGGVNIGAADARAAADAAQRQALATRLIAEAAERAAAGEGVLTEQTRLYVQAARAAAIESDRHADELVREAGALERLQIELNRTGTGAQLLATKQGGAANSAGALRAAMQGASFQVQDTFTQLSMGANVLQVVAIQGGQLAGQFANIEGRAGSFARFMIGPYGLALTAAALVAGPLLSSILNTDEALSKETDKLKENAENAGIAAEAKRAFARTEAGAIDDVRALTEELKRQNEELGTNAERQNIRAKSRLEVLTGARSDVVDQLAEARQAITNLSRPGVSSERGAGAAIKAAQEQVAALEARLARIDTVVAQAQAAVTRTRADLAGEAAKRAVDPVAQINRRYDAADGLIESAKRRATAEQRVNGELTKQLITLERHRKAELDAVAKAQAKVRNPGNNNQLGREIDVAEARSIIAGIGGRVTSGLRSRADQERIYADKLAGRHAGPVAKPGHSDHERGQAVDVAYGPGISIASIRQAFAKQGVALRQILDEPAQRVFHVAFGKRGPSRETVENRAEAARQKVLANDIAYTDQERAARQRLLAATRRGADTEEQKEAAATESAQVERDATRQKIADQLSAKKITAAQADHLNSLNEATYTQQLQNEIVERATRQLDRQYEVAQGDLQSRLAVLRINEDLATTARERRVIARQILNAEQELRRQALQRVRDTSNDPKAVQSAKDELGRLPATEAAENRQFDARSAGALDQYRERLKAATLDTSAALEDIGVRGLGALEDRVASAASKVLGLKGAFGDMVNSAIADLARLAIQKAIVAAIGTGAKFFGIPLADGGPVLRRAGGGPISGPGGPRDDLVPALLSNGEFVVNAAAYARNRELVEAINAHRLPRLAAGGPIRAPRLPRMNASGGGGARDGAVLVRVALSDDLHATIANKARDVSVEVIRSAAPELVQASTNNTINELRKQTL